VLGGCKHANEIHAGGETDETPESGEAATKSSVQIMQLVGGASERKDCVGERAGGDVMEEMGVRILPGVTGEDAGRGIRAARTEGAEPSISWIAAATTAGGGVLGGEGCCCGGGDCCC
jgi:hypothetical protein